MLKRWTVMGAIMATLVGFSAAVAAPAITEHPYVLPGSHVEVFTASTGVQYQISVFLPASYGKTNRTYPVLYLMDGDKYGPMFDSLARTLERDGDIPDLIVVGVDWSKDGDRYLDLPTLAKGAQWEIPANRGAANFLHTLQTEIFPRVEKAYRIDPTNRGIGGHSLGGFFSLYGLFNGDGMFQHVWVSSPSMVWDHNEPLREEQGYAAHHADLKARVFADCGALEDANLTGPLEILTDTIADRHFPSLHWRTDVAENGTHGTTPYLEIAKALLFLYGPDYRAIPPVEIGQLVGDYRTATGETLSLFGDGEALYVRGLGEYDGTRLVSVVPGEYLARYVHLTIKAQLGKDPVGQITIHQGLIAGPNEDAKDIVAVRISSPQVH
jgi:predicted alpha/beta superfamily hydrolase